MYRFLLCISLIAILGVLGNYFLFKQANSTAIANDIAHKMASAELEHLLTADPALGKIPHNRLWKASQQTLQLKQQLAKSNNTATIPWDERGPTNIGGRIRAFIFDNNDPTLNTAYAGGVTGGLWRTTNFQSAEHIWTPLSDQWTNMGVCAIVQDPNNANNIYVGTGETWTLSSHPGAGIWKSTDGGDTWNQLTSTANADFKYVHKLVFDTNGHLYACTKEAGLQKSIDGGNSWTKVLGNGVSGGNSDIAADIAVSANGDIWVSLGGWNESDGIYKSEIAPNGAATGDVNKWINMALPESFNRIALAAAPSNANVLYALCSTGQVDAVYKTISGGTSWSKMTNLSTATNLLVQSNYNLAIAVDPKDEDTILAGAVGFFKSLDGGNSWTYTLLGHADQHHFVFLPTSNATSDSAVVCNDGGIYLAKEINSNPNLTRNDDKNNFFNVTQYYGGDIHPTAYSDYMIAGSQDNAAQKFDTPDLGSAEYAILNGDHGFCHIDENEPNFQIIAGKQNVYFTSNDAGENFDFGLIEQVGSFISRSDYDDSSNILYARYNGGFNFLRWNNPQSGNDYDIVPISNGDAGFAISVSPNVANRVYFGSSTNIVRIDDAHTGTSKTGTIIKNVLGGHTPSRIEIEDGNEDHILVTYSNYGVNSVWETHDATAATPTWTSVEGNLPDMPVRWAIFAPNNPDQALLATETGVWFTEDLDGTNTVWQPYTDFPTVRTDMLRARSSDNLVAAFTYGRGVFTTQAFDTNPPANDFCTNALEIPINSSIKSLNLNATTSMSALNPICYSGAGNYGRDIWFQFKPLYDFEFEIGVNESGFTNTYFVLFDGDCNNLTNNNIVTCGFKPTPNDAEVILTTQMLEADKTYYLQLWDTNSSDFSQTEVFVRTTGCAHSDYPPLLALYNATDGDNWTNSWDVENSCNVCEWQGVTCKNGRVTSISLVNNNLSGMLPPEIGAFSELEQLYILLNPNLTGVIPPEIGQLSNLNLINFTNNELDGQLPPELAQLTNLIQLRIGGNNFSGCLSSDFNVFCQSGATVLLSGNNTEVLNQDFENFCASSSGVCAALSLTLTNFKATTLNFSNQIEWFTQNERDLAYFELQRSNDGKKNWITLEIVKPQGGSERQQTYQVFDQSPSVYSYYRLKIIENSGETDFSNIIHVQRSTNEAFEIYPNPVREVLYVNNLFSTEEPASLSIYDALGHLKITRPIQNKIELSTQSLEVGTYWIQITNSKDIFTTKIVVQK